MFPSYKDELNLKIPKSLKKYLVTFMVKGGEKV